MIWRRVDVVGVTPIVMPVANLSAPAAVALPPGLWSFDVAYPGLWHETQYIWVPATNDVQAEMLAAGNLAAVMAPAPKLGQFEQIQVVLMPQDGARHHIAQCTRDENRLLCPAPTGLYDVRFKYSGYSSALFEDIKIDRASTTEIGVVKFEAGASVSGRIEGPPNIQLKEARIIATRRGEDSPEIELKASRRGLVQITGLSAGTYTVRAQHPDGLRSAAVDVQLRARAEVTLPSPLELMRPMSVFARITPPLTPEDRPWHVSLIRYIAGVELEKLATVRASRNGTAEFLDIAPGAYVLRVGSDETQTWSREEVEVVGRDEIVSVVLNTREVTGEVLLGRSPLAAKLTFISSERALTVTSDENGSFALILPVEEPNDASEWTVEISSAQPFVMAKTFLTLLATEHNIQIALPDTELRGRAIDTSGRAVQGAKVRIAGESAQDDNPPRTADDGTFSVRSLRAGEYTVFADAGENGRSDAEVVSIDETVPTAPVSLVVKPHATFTGRALTTTGPVMGASILVAPIGLQFPRISTAITDGNGEFTVAVPRETGEASIIVAPPDRPLTVQRVDVSAGSATIAIPSQGGTLNLDSLRPNEDESLMLWRDNARVFLAWIVSRWPISVKRDGIVLGQMAPGHYRLCASIRCVSGLLMPAGNLTLDLKQLRSAESPR
jgi:hypothetical protein